MFRNNVATQTRWKIFKSIVIFAFPIVFGLLWWLLFKWKFWIFPCWTGAIIAEIALILLVIRICYLINEKNIAILKLSAANYDTLSNHNYSDSYVSNSIRTDEAASNNIHIFIHVTTSDNGRFKVSKIE